MVSTVHIDVKMGDGEHVSSPEVFPMYYRVTGAVLVSGSRPGGRCAILDRRKSLSFSIVGTIRFGPGRKQSGNGWKTVWRKH